MFRKTLPLLKHGTVAAKPTHQPLPRPVTSPSRAENTPSSHYAGLPDLFFLHEIQHAETRADDVDVNDSTPLPW